jgi:hypothetical protein
MLTIKIPMLSNFSLGLLVCTNRINDKIEQDNKFKKFVEESLARYTSSDWGDACNEDVKMNNDAIRNSDRILAVYTQKYRCYNLDYNRV